MHLENKPKKANNQTKILGDWLLSTQYVLVIVLGCLGCKIHPFYLVSSIFPQLLCYSLITVSSAMALTV